MCSVAPSWAGEGSSGEPVSVAHPERFGGLAAECSFAECLAEQSRRNRRPLDACEMSDHEDGFVIDLGTGTGVSISSLELMDVPDRQSTDGRRR